MLRSPHYEFPRRRAVEVANPEITAKPSLEGVSLLHKRSDDLACAEACINSAITKSTTCTVGDLQCECQGRNALSIWLGSSNCVLQGCGVSVWLAASSIASRNCVTALGGQYTAPTVVVTSIQTASGAASTAGSGSGSGTTSVAANQGGSSAGSNSSPSLAGSTSASLSPGAIAGIAIGGVAGGILICVALLLVFRWGRRSGKKSGDGSAAMDGQTSLDPGAATSAPPVETKPELDGAKTGVAPLPEFSGHTQTTSANGGWRSVSATSSPPPEYPGWQHQQQHYSQPLPPQQLDEVSSTTAYQGPQAQEMHATSWRPEMGGDPSQMRHEMPTQAHSGNVYEMPSGPPT